MLFNWASRDERVGQPKNGAFIQLKVDEGGSLN